MDRGTKRKLAVATAAGLAVAGGGAAIAASQLGSPKAESQAVVNDAARQLGVQPSALSDALKKALKNRVDAAVAAGRLTKEQADAIKSRIDSGDFPLFGGPGLGRPHGDFDSGFGHLGHLDAAATYLGLTETQLRSELAGGKTLAQIAKDRDKSVDGLIQVFVDAAKKKLDAAVTAGRLTKAQEETILSDLKQRFTDFVNGKAPQELREHFGFRFRHGPERIGPPAM